MSVIPIITVEYLPYFNETKLLAHSMLSGKNYDEAKIELGFLYLRGDGVTQDTKKAIDLFRADIPHPLGILLIFNHIFFC